MAFGRLGTVGAGFGHLGAGTGPSGPAAAAGGAALLAGETDGFAADFTYATDASRVAVKAASVTTSYDLDAFFLNTGTSPKLVFDVTGALVWSPHNMFINSAVPATQNVTTVVGQNYTVTVTGSGSMTGSAGASGVATAGSPLTYTATTTTSTFTKAGTVTQIQMNRGAVATAYLATASARNGLSVDYHPSTHAALGLRCEPSATNLLLNSATLSTQSVTVTAVAHTLSFFGTGTITLTGVSTAGPLVGTGASDRVTLTFTPTAGSLTCTVSGTVSNAQLETGSAATSIIPTFGASATRAGDNYYVTSASISYSATAGSWWTDLTLPAFTTAKYILSQTTSSFNIQSIGNVATIFELYDGAAQLQRSVTNVAGSHKIACAFQSADRALTADGLTVITSAVAGVALLSPGANIYFGSNSSGLGQPNGYIRKLRYVPRRKTNPELVTETI